MKRFGRWSAGLGLCAVGAFAPTAFGATTGHVGVFSDYVFRGIVADGGVAVQGGVDHMNANGLLAGVWASNADKFGGSEFDVYAGYLHKITDKLMVDVGALYYFLTEDKEVLTDLDENGQPDRRDLDTLEWFGTVFYGPLKAQVYYSHDYVATRAEGYYYTATYTHTINPTISLAAQAGYTHGNGPEALYGDEYVDYSVMLNKVVREGLVFTLGFIDTTLRNEGGGIVFPNTEDDPKVMVSVKQTFAF